MAKSKKVVLMIQDGIVSVIKCAKDVQVVVRDHDIDGSKLDNVEKDEYGDYVETELEKPM